MAANNEPVSFRCLATVIKYGHPDIKLAEAQILASELKHVIDCSSIEWTHTTVNLLQFSEEAIHHGLCSHGTAKDKIQAVVDYQKSHSSLPMRDKYKILLNPISTSPNRIIKELQAVLEGNIDFVQAAELSDDFEVSTLPPDAEVLAAQTFLYRNRHYGFSDERVVQSFQKALQYQKGELRTSTEFIKCKEKELTEIIKCVNLHFIEESIDIIGFSVAKRVMANIKSDSELPKSNKGDVYHWEVFQLSEVDSLLYRDRESIFKGRSDDYILAQWGYEQGQKSCRWYIFCAQDEHSKKGFYAMKFTKTLTTWGTLTAIKDVISVNKSDPVEILKRFQAGKENGLVDSEFQQCNEYLWSRDGKPPARPYFVVAQIFWPLFVHKLNYLSVQNKKEVTDKEALTGVFTEMPFLTKDKRKADPTLKTYTWFLNKPINAVNDFPELKDYSEGQTFTVDYLRPSTEPLRTEGFNYEWSRKEHESTHHEFTLIYRARPTLFSVPQTISEEERIRFDYWQYIKEFIFFGGSHYEGTVLAPDPAWIDQAHRNGVAIFGTVFLPPRIFGGSEQDIKELSKLENLERLVDIAQQLNFDGWFLNVESFLDYSDPCLEMLKCSIENVNFRGKTIIWYLPKCEQSEKLKPENPDVRMTCDDEINNLSQAFLDPGEKRVYLNFQQLMVCVLHNEPPQKYLMFVDEPFWTIKLETHGYLVNPGRYLYAHNCHWQFFLGEHGLEQEATDPYRWYGIAKYAKQRKELSDD